MNQLQVIGLAVLSGGIYLLVQSSKYTDIFETPETAAAVVTVTGVVISLVAFFGCCGALRDGKCMLHTVSNFFFLPFPIVNVIVVCLSFTLIATSSLTFCFLSLSLSLSFSSMQLSSPWPLSLRLQEPRCQSFT